ncbi:hypothetical protein PBY51_000962 [Eleginops maclovinus]|uniref:Uncharacterized protein n=1 Tax=Eleginops maclovinus TaxID=56733 RepID=A0AAN8AL45_ELEMC|nr:hypothetical protein PBY51_000962 [Eleginops maclovinus]
MDVRRSLICFFFLTLRDGNSGLINAENLNPSPERTTPPHQGTTAPAAGHGVVLYVGGILLVMFIILSVTLLIFCRKRARKEPPLGIDNGTDTEANQQYEEIREEGRRSRSPPVELSTVYSYANYKPNGEESTDEYSLVTAAKTEDDEGNLEYSEVDFSNNAASLHSALSGHTDNVLYAVHRAADASPPLYSTVSM